MEFVYAGGGLGKAGTATLYVDGKKVGEGRVERTHAFLFSMDETMDVGRDVGGSVSTDYDAKGSDDRFAERGDSKIAGRPELIKGNRQIVYGGLTRVPSLAMVNMANRSYAITAEVEIPKSGAEGVIVAIGGVTGGWSLYAKNGKPKFCYNFFGLEQTFVEGSKVIPAGEHQVRMEFKYDGGGIAKGGKVSLYLDGKKAGEGRIERTEPFAFGEESLDVGHEAGSPVTTDYPKNGASYFTGEVKWVEFDTDTAADDHNHLITPEEKFMVAMAKQ